jgi:hypothetical protein
MACVYHCAAIRVLATAARAAALVFGRYAVTWGVSFAVALWGVAQWPMSSAPLSTALDFEAVWSAVTGLKCGRTLSEALSAVPLGVRIGLHAAWLCGSVYSLNA